MKNTQKKHQLVTQAGWELVCMLRQEGLSIIFLSSQFYFCCSPFHIVLMEVSSSRFLIRCPNPSKGLIRDIQEISFPSVTFCGSSSVQLLTNRRDA